MSRKKSSVVEQVVGPWRNRITGYGEEDPKQLLANDRNWRIHTHDQEKSLSAVLNKVGIVQSILVNQRSGKVVDGHLRAAMAISEGQSRVPVVYVNLSDEEEALILATFDRITAMAGVDNEKLEELVTEAAENFPDLAEILNGIDEYIERGGPETSKQGLIEDDAVPEPQAAVVTTLGDCWLLGAHRLICGDSTKESDVQAVLRGDVPFLMVTDPPYGVDYDPEWRNDAFGEANRATGKVRNDDQADWSLAYRLFPGDVAYVWHAGNKAAEVAVSLLGCGFVVRAQIIWAKQHFVISRGHYHGQHEPCWYAVRKGKRSNWSGDRTQSTLWSVNNGLSQGGPREPENAVTGHGTQKPVEVMRRPILNHTKPGEMVYEPFAGSGTTLIACEKEGRICRAIELDPKYCDVIVRRWQDFTGKQATLDGTDRTFDEIAAERQPVAA